MKWQNALYVLVALALLGAGTLWFLENFEKKEIEIYTGYKGEARSNPLFAARLFLKRMGIPAERHDGLTNLPSTDSVIILNTQRYNLSANKTQELLDWVAQGGHLITRARSSGAHSGLFGNNDEDETDERSEPEKRDPLQAALDISIGPHIMPDDADLPVLFKPANSEETLNIELDFFHSLKTTRDDSIHYQLGQDTWYIEQPHGAGYVSLLTSLDLLENPELADADHGKLLWYLVHMHKGVPERVWLVHQDTLPSLFTLLGRHAFPLLVTLGLLLLFIFWAFIPRFGSIIPEPAPQRRRILDHIKASGQFLWQRQDKGRAQLCSSLQQSIRQQAQQHIPGWQLMPAADQHTVLAQHLQQSIADQMNTDQLQRLLTAEQLDEQDFTRLVQLAQHMRKSL